MILSGLEIKKRLGGQIKITPFDEKLLNPNSYNLRLHNELLVYELESGYLDMKKPNPTRKITIPEDGMVIAPGTLYLGRTFEMTETSGLVPMLNGRSSIGRLGLTIHVTAGFGDVGFKGFWTLEIFCIHPVKIYPYIQICQIYYHTIEGDFKPYESGKYQGNTDIQPSLLYKDFDKNFN
ncbi:MAG: dCTP deaminase [Defluviitaleaceae bacterium]|nr:dCTP deaminase [Defluviitaleaceae bacterium]